MSDIFQVAAQTLVDIEKLRPEFQDPQELILRLRRNVADYNEITDAIIDYFQTIKSKPQGEKCFTS